MNIFIVLIEVDGNNDARKQCELIENHLFQIKPKEGQWDRLSTYKVREAVYDFLGDNSIGVNVYKPTEFMEFCNDQEINLENFFLSYVQAEIVKL